MESSADLSNKVALKGQDSFNRAMSTDVNQEIFIMPRQRSRSRERRESRMFLVDGQLCWSNDQPMMGLRGKRNSSVGLFGSSIDLSGIGQSMDSSGGAGSGTEEAISYKIKWCRENIMQLKRQTWPMEKKLQVLKASKQFIKQHQGELKQSKQAKDVIASTSAIFERYWRHFKREFANFLVIITPWEMRIKKIESHFGSVVASYFTFLRWIFWLNLANSLVMVSFVMVPELIENVPDLTAMRKGELGAIQAPLPDGKPAPPPDFNPTLGEMWEFEGFLKFSPIFYGYYSNVEISRSGFWRNPLAFLMSAMLTYLFCFFCISRKLSQNTKLSRIGSKDDEYTFCWTVFVGWDFMIGNSETAYNKTSSLVMNLKEGILEEKEQTKDRDWRLIIRRVLANVLTLMLIVASAYVVTLAVQRSENLPEDASLLQKNELQLVMSGIQFMFPPLFDVIGIIEKYHPRKALSWQLGRILFLDFLNFYTLMFSLFGTVDQMGIQLNEVTGNITMMRKNATYYNNLFTTTTTTTTTTISPPSTTSLSPANDSTTLQTNSTSDGLNTTTILTSVLLASSTMMPSANMSNETLASTTTLGSVSSMSSTLNQSPILISTTVAAILAVKQQTSTTLPETRQTFMSSTIWTTSSPITSSTPLFITSSTISQKSPEEEDYPDLGEQLKPAPNPKLILKREVREIRVKSGAGKKRIKPIQPNTEIDDDVIRFETEREDLGVSDDLIKRTTSFAKQPLIGAFIPQMRDPYRKETRDRWPVLPIDSEEEEEEPLEGRLEPVRPHKTTSTTRRPNHIGLARPIGGKQDRQFNALRGSRVKMTSAPSLDDDVNEDVIEDSTTRGLQVEMSDQTSRATTSSSIQPQSDSSAEIFFEPTTPKLTSGSIGPDYSVLTSELTTLTTTDDQLTPGATVSSSDQPMGKSGLSNSFTETSSVEQSAGTSEKSTNPSSQTVISCTPFAELTTSFNSSINKTNSISNLKKSGFNASEVNYSDCIEIPEVKYQEILALNDTLKDKLKSLCWETMFGQEMVKIVVMDLVMTVISAVSFEFMRACFVRYCNRFFFWDLERGFPGYQDFKLAENVLHLVNNQSTVWMGMFFAPGLPAINTVKLAVLMYVRSWAVLTCNIPHETVFKVSKSNNFYYWILLINLLICILPVAYAVTWIRPSWHCGPFGGECRMYIVVTKLVKSLLPPEANSVFRYLTSPGAVIPILISLILIIYYLASTVSSSKEANKELKAQLKKDKEQEAAVPEITNTTVVDSAPPPPIQPTPASTNPIIASSSLNTSITSNQNTLTPAMPTKVPSLPLKDSQETTLEQNENRPKSLLAPPAP